MIMVTAGDSGASLTARSERGAAGAALGGRGERAEKADSGASQPHIEGTLIYVIARFRRMMYVWIFQKKSCLLW